MHKLPDLIEDKKTFTAFQKNPSVFTKKETLDFQTKLETKRIIDNKLNSLDVFNNYFFEKN